MTWLPKETVAKPTHKQLVDPADHQAARDLAQAVAIRLHLGVEAEDSRAELAQGRSYRRRRGGWGAGRVLPRFRIVFFGQSILTVTAVPFGP